MKKLILLITACILLSLAGPGWATTYYIRADGTAATKGAATSDSATSTAMNLTVHNATTFSAGDTIVVSDAGGAYRGQLTPPSSGSAGSPITYQKNVGGSPLIYRSTALATGDWTLAYNVGGVKVWSASVAGNTDYYGVVVGGHLAEWEDPSVDLALSAIPNNHFFCRNGTGVGYYRNDAGNPGAAEIGTRSYGVLVDSKNYITITGIDFYGPGGSTDNVLQWHSPWRSTVDIRGTSDHIIVDSSTIQYSSAYAAFAHGGTQQDNGLSQTTNVTFSNLTVHNCATGIYQNSTNGIVSGCKIYDIGLYAPNGDVFGIGIQWGPTTIAGNEIYHIGLDTGEADHAIQLATNTGETYSITITRNFIHDVPCGGIGVDGGGTNAIVAYNIVNHFGYTTNALDASGGHWSGIRVGGGAGGCPGTHIYNNVIANGANNVTHSTATASLFLGLDCTNTLVKNNIFYNNAGEDVIVWSDVTLTGLKFDYNCYYGNTNTYHWNFQEYTESTFAAWKSAISSYGGDTNSIVTNPVFVNAGGSFALSTDFKLQAGSPCINAGVNVGLTTDYGQNTIRGLPDVGAWEFSIKGGIW